MNNANNNNVIRINDSQNILIDINEEYLILWWWIQYELLNTLSRRTSFFCVCLLKCIIIIHCKVDHIKATWKYYWMFLITV